MRTKKAGSSRTKDEQLLEEAVAIASADRGTAFADAGRLALWPAQASFDARCARQPLRAAQPWRTQSMVS